MAMHPHEYPPGKQPHCACSDRTDGELQPSIMHGNELCSRCWCEVRWEDVEPVEIPGQETLDL